MWSDSGSVVASVDLRRLPASFRKAELHLRRARKTETSFEVRLTLRAGGREARAGSLYTYGEGPVREGEARQRIGELRVDVTKALRDLGPEAESAEVVVEYFDHHGRRIERTDFDAEEVALTASA